MESAGHTAGVFTPQVLDYFASPRCAGELPGATASVEVTNPACGDILQLAARIESGRIVEARFLARGCVTSIACGSFLAESLQGRTIVEARAITAESIAMALGGLPPATYHGSQLARDALAALLARIA